MAQVAVSLVCGILCCSLIQLKFNEGSCCQFMKSLHFIASVKDFFIMLLILDIQHTKETLDSAYALKTQYSFVDTGRFLFLYSGVGLLAVHSHRHLVTGVETSSVV